MADKKKLGKVVKVHDSGMVTTDEGHRANIKAQVGQELEMDDSRKVSIVEVTEDTTSKKTETAAKKETKEIPKVEYDGLGVDELKTKFTVVELRQICKQEKREGYSRLQENALANLIVFGHKDGEQKQPETEAKTEQTQTPENPEGGEAGTGVDGEADQTSTETGADGGAE